MASIVTGSNLCLPLLKIMKLDHLHVRELQMNADVNDVASVTMTFIMTSDMADRLQKAVDLLEALEDHPADGGPTRAINLSRREDR